MKRYIFFLFVALLSVSCSIDDDNNENTITINGNWNLSNVSGGLLGLDQDFDRGVVVWAFNESNNTLTITNENTLTEVYSGLPSGTYSYTISSPADAEVLIVDDVIIGEIAISNGSFTLEEISIDGLKLNFGR